MKNKIIRGVKVFVISGLFAVANCPWVLAVTDDFGLDPAKNTSVVPKPEDMMKSTVTLPLGSSNLPAAAISTAPLPSPFAPPALSTAPLNPGPQTNPGPKNQNGTRKLLK